MGSSKAATREVSDAELEREVRALVQRASGLARAELKKELGADYKKHHARALEIARALAGSRELHRWTSGTTKERFFASEPFDALEKAVKNVLADGPLDEPELKRRLGAEGRGLGDLLKDWLKGATGRGDIFVHAKQGTKPKRFGLEPPEPDIGRVFKNAFAALHKALSTKDGIRIPRRVVLAAFAKELGLADAPATEHPADETSVRSPGSAVRSDTERASFIRALRELTSEAVGNGLLPIRDLRSRLRLDKQSFDRLSLELSREGVVTLHHHDFPASLSAAQREDMVADDRGTHYVGIALRRSHG